MNQSDAWEDINHEISSLSQVVLGRAGLTLGGVVKELAHPSSFQRDHTSVPRTRYRVSKVQRPSRTLSVRLSEPYTFARKP